jgi:hypothetical protein
MTLRSAPRTLRRPLAALAVAGLVFVACSDDSAAPATTSVAPTTVVSTVSTVSTVSPATDAPSTDPSTTDAARPAGFQRVVPEGDCNCADGSEFALYVRVADPAKVLFYFQGGGACFNASTCKFQGGTYKVTTDGGDNPSDLGGIWDATNPANPFADYSVVFVPYCTGDVHIGDAEREYAPGLVVDHNGANNGRAALDLLVDTFPDATQVVVAGESAGSIATPLYAGLVADRLPDAGIVVLADSSGAYPDVAALNVTIGSQWGTANAIPDWPENKGLTAEQWSLPGLFVQAGRHAPRIVFARHDYASDGVQTFFLGIAGAPTDNLLGLIDANERQIEGAGVNLYSYVADGVGHTVLSSPDFYTERTGGVLLVDWVTRLLRGDDVGDVRCDTCA